MDEDRYDLDWLDLLEKLAFTGWTEARLLMLVGSLAWAWGSRHCNVNSLISYFSERGKIGERFPEAGRKALKYLRFSRCIEFGWRIGTVNARSSRSLCCIASRYSKIFTAFLFFPFLSILFFPLLLLGERGMLDTSRRRSYWTGIHSCDWWDPAPIVLRQHTHRNRKTHDNNVGRPHPRPYSQTR